LLSCKLQEALLAARSDDSVNVILLDEQRQQVQRRLMNNEQSTRPSALISGRVSLWSLLVRPSVQWSASAIAIVILALVFVPFSHYRTVGYDVSVDGVSRELALNHDLMCELLTRLGLVEAGIDVLGCDTTCSVSILDLKSEREARLVVGAFARLGETDLTTNIVPIRAKSSRTLLERANDMIGRGDS
jgi:hypothetical protein